MSTQMAKLFAAAGQAVPEVKYIFELNPDHPLVKRAADTQDDARLPSGLNCCWISPCWPSAARWKILTCSLNV
jgi:HSP90 family molecular chaperone